MKAPALEHTSAAKAGWVVIVLTVGWLVFLLLPDPLPEPTAAADTIPPQVSSLTRSGLREYADWEGLPEIFAIWADKAEWKNNRTRFAYWHPVMKNYSYFFEAVRTAKGYRFREITEQRDSGHHWDESLGADCPIQFYVTSPAPRGMEPMPVRHPVVEPDAPQTPSAVPVELPTPKAGQMPVKPDLKP